MGARPLRQTVDQREAGHHGADPRQRCEESRVVPDAPSCAMPDDVPMRRRVMVVDDHAGFRASVRELLAVGPFEIVAEAADAQAALEAFDRTRPDVVLLDVALPGTDGFGVAEALALHDPPPAVVLTSTRDAADYGPRIGAAPVRGFVQKAALSVGSLEVLVR